MKTKKNPGFTFIEILLGLSISAAILIVATTLVVNLFSSTTKSRQIQVLEQVKNDLQAEFSNSVRWADNISFVSDDLQIDGAMYTLEDGILLKDGDPITPQEVEITKFEVLKRNSSGAGSEPENTGTGLTAQYFNNADLTDLVFTQTDFLIDFDWGAGSPDPLVAANSFSARYSGKIEAPVNSTYTFYVHSDEGARLWVNDRLVINDWVGLGYDERAGIPISLEGGKKYDIKLEYYENFGDAKLSLYWSYFGASKLLVPTGRLYSTTERGSIEILVDLQNRISPFVSDSMKLVLSPRSGIIGIIE